MSKGRNTMTKNEIKAALDLAGVAYAKKANLETLQALYAEHIREVNCPGCGICLDNGVLTPDDEVANKPGVTLHMEGQTKEFHCMGCGHEWGPERDAYVAPVSSQPTGTGLKIEKDRPEQNGIKRPSIGGKCRAIWDALDAYVKETGEQPTSKTVKELAADEGWNPNNASIEFYQWRKFHGITKSK
jgi:hypothetical protein